MSAYEDFFGDKRVLVMGLGLLGRGVGDAAFIADCGAREVVVTDKKTADELAESVARLKNHKNVFFHLGGHRVEDFTACDMVIKAAGVRSDSSEIAAAREAGVPVYMSTALFAKFAGEAGGILVGVTGTRGKTTVSSMIYHTLQQAGRRALLGGNVRGKSTLAMISEVVAGDIVVLELDSWQLQGFGDMQMSPHISVFTNLMPDHQNYYDGDMEAYFADKANVFRFQKEGDLCVAGNGLTERMRTAHTGVSRCLFPPPLPQEWTLKVLGEHNRENASLAAAALKALGLSEAEIRAGLGSFEPVEGRLQFIREVRGVKIFNDNNSTTPEATIAALRALPGNTALVTGGSEKELDLKELVGEIKKRVSKVILLVHENYKGSERMAAELKAAGVAYEEAKSLESAVLNAMQDTKEGNLLFSPGFASFGMFKNEYERNDEFVRVVKGL